MQVQFKLNHDYVVRDGARTGYFVENRQITEYLIRESVNAKYRSGISDKTAQRTHGKMQKALDTAVNKKQDVVDLSVEQVRFVYDCLKEWSVPSEAVTWFIDLFEYVETLIIEMSKK